LSQVAIRWIKQFVSKDVFTDSDCLARVVKAFEVPVTGFRPIDEVISTVGGVAVEEIDESGQLKKYPQVYCCGEMVDWDAPTGGYLIQGCVSSGWAVGSAIKSTLKSH
jgi:predicted flavoprotein YhiN